MTIRAPVIITMNGAPILDGAVRVRGDRIAEVGAFSELAVSTGKEEIIELDDHVLLPGLINAHCHLDYTGLRGKIPPPQSFTNWIRAINAEKAKLTDADYIESIESGSREALRFGTTAIVNLEAFPELVARCSTGPLRIWWCAELIDVAAPEKTKEILAEAVDCIARSSIGGFGLAPHALFTATQNLYRECQRFADSSGWLLTTHLAESREEMQMFCDATGPLFEFIRSFGRDTSDCDGSPLQRFLETIGGSPKALGAQDGNKPRHARWTVGHLNEVGGRDFDLLKELPDKFSIAHCPRSHAYFRHSPFAFERLQSIGFNICLATDSLASNCDLSLFAEMREFQKSRGRIQLGELLQMVTVNPAKALGRTADLGKIAPGFLADLIALPVCPSARIYEPIIAFDGEVPWMMIGGKVL